MASVFFRAGTVAVVQHPDSRVLVFERKDVPGQWQLPQGGLEPGESAVAGVWRELEEETGLGSDHVRLVREHPDWTSYEWPDELKKPDRWGQIQRWFFFAPLDAAVEPVPDDHEFMAWKWAEVPWLIEQVVDFRRQSYRQVLES